MYQMQETCTLRMYLFQSTNFNCSLQQTSENSYATSALKCLALKCLTCLHVIPLNLDKREQPNQLEEVRTQGDFQVVV